MTTETLPYNLSIRRCASTCFNFILCILTCANGCFHFSMSILTCANGHFIFHTPILTCANWVLNLILASCTCATACFDFILPARTCATTRFKMKMPVRPLFTDKMSFLLKRFLPVVGMTELLYVLVDEKWRASRATSHLLISKDYYLSFRSASGGEESHPMKSNLIIN